VVLNHFNFLETQESSRDLLVLDRRQNKVPTQYKS